ncbi:hypothetical protein [Glutamicibacter sp. BSL13]
MPLAETLTCTTILEPPNYVQFMQGWVTSVDCDLLSNSHWKFGWEGMAAVGTLLAVCLSWYFSWQARKDAQKETLRADARQAELRELQDQVEKREMQRELREQQNAEFEQRRHAEQVAAWLTPAGPFYEESFIAVANHSQFPIWSVVLNHDSFGASKTVIYPTISAGSINRIEIGDWASTNYDVNTDLLLAQTVSVTFVDINGRTWQRPAGDVPLLREITNESRTSGQPNQ